MLRIEYNGTMEIVFVRKNEVKLVKYLTIT